MGLFTKKSLPDTKTFKQEYKFGFSDRAKLLEGLKDIAKYNPTLSAAIRHIISNCFRVNYSEWNGENEVTNSLMVKLIEKPSAYLSKKTIFGQMFYDYLIWGNAYAKIEKVGETVYLNPIPYPMVKPVYDKNEDGLIDISSLKYEVSISNKTIEIPAEEMFVWSDMSYGMENYRGVPKIIHLLYAVSNSDNADRFNESYIKNGGIPAGFFSSEITNENKLQELKEQWDKSHKGSDKSGAIGFIGGNLKWIETGSKLNDMSFENLKKISREEILSLYNIPPLLLGITNDVNYSIAKMQRKLFIEITVKPIVDSFADSIQSMFVNLYPAKKFGKLYADVDSLPEMQDDLLTKLQAAMYAVNLGYDINDVAEKLNLPFDKVSQSVPVIETPKSFSVLKSSTRDEFRETMKTLMHSRKTKVERGYILDLEKFFVTIRNSLLDKSNEIANRKSLISDYVNEILFFANSEMNDWNKNLKYITGKYFGNVSRDVAQRFIEDVGLTYRQTAQEAFVMSNRINKITRVNETTYKLLDDKLKSAIANGDDYRSAIDAVTQEIRATLEDRKGGAGTIAQTEGNGYANEVIDVSYRDNGVEKISWLTSRDELVRPTHAAIDGETISINGMFTNGLRYPGDQIGEAGEVINCRCSTLPEE